MKKRTFWHVPLKKTDQLAHLYLQIRIVVVRRDEDTLHLLGYPKFAQSRFWSDCVNAHANQN